MIAQFFSQNQIDSFEYPWVLFLCIVPIIYLMFVVASRGRFLRYVRFPTLTAVDPNSQAIMDLDGIQFEADTTRRITSTVRTWMGGIAILFFFISYLFLTIALAHPYGGVTIEARAEGIDIYFALDMSASMRAYDFSIEDMQARHVMDVRTPNRFDVARETIQDFIRTRYQRCHEGSRVVARCDRVGIILFGHRAFVDVPLTIDYQMLIDHLDHRNVDDIDASESAIADGIMAAVASLRHSESKSHNLILVSDGDKKGGSYSIGQAIVAAQAYDVSIYPVMIGESDKAVIAQKNYDGYTTFNEATFPVNETLLQNLADETDGIAYRASTDVEFQSKLDEILDRLEPNVSIDSRRERQVDLSRNYILMAFICMFLFATIYLGVYRRYP